MLGASQRGGRFVPYCLASEITASADEPVDHDDGDNDAVDGADVVHIYANSSAESITTHEVKWDNLTSSPHRHRRRKTVHDQRKSCPS